MTKKLSVLKQTELLGHKLYIYTDGEQLWFRAQDFSNLFGYRLVNASQINKIEDCDKCLTMLPISVRTKKVNFYFFTKKGVLDYMALCARRVSLDAKRAVNTMFIELGSERTRKASAKKTEEQVASNCNSEVAEKAEELTIENYKVKTLLELARKLAEANKLVSAYFHLIEGDSKDMEQFYDYIAIQRSVQSAVQKTCDMISKDIVARLITV